MNNLLLRIAAFPLGILLFAVGTYYVYEDIVSGISFREYSRMGIAATVVGVVLLLAVTMRQLASQGAAPGQTDGALGPGRTER